MPTDDASSDPAVIVSDRSRLTAHVAADPLAATRARREFASWLTAHYLLNDERLSDLLLAVYEALVNAAEFAYLDTSSPCGVVLTACHRPDTGTLTVTVIDSGRWRPPDPSTPFRGHGIPLMRVLADEMTIDGTTNGTVVTLVWSHVASAYSHELR